MADEPRNPMKPSGDYDAQRPYWDMVDAILGGAETMRHAVGYGGSTPGPTTPVSSIAQLTRGGSITGPESPYLPRFRNETEYDYDCRRKHAPFTNIYSDISGNLASKPFAKTLTLEEGTADDLMTLAEDIDGQGNSLHVFARETFKKALDYAVDWILVDYTKVPPGATLADERTMGARPYWVHIPADRLLAVYSAFIAGEEIIYHARIYEPTTQVVGYDEVMVQRVRVLEREPIIDAEGKTTGYGPAYWELWEAIRNDKGEDVWNLTGEGEITIGIIPLVPFIAGKRQGTCWRVEPPLRDIAYMQVEEFQQESNLKTIKEQTAFPMLTGNGVTPPTDASGALIAVPVGPRAVLFAPPGGDGAHGEWSYIEPSASSLTFLQADLEKHRNEMRTLGMQPMASANLTVVTTANLSMKASSAVQAWAIGLKDCLEQAWIITCKWMLRDDEVVVLVHTDFAIELNEGQDVTALLSAQKQGILSTRTVQDELKRRGVLSDDFDPEEEDKLLAEQDEALQPEMMIDPKTGMPIAPKPPGAAGNVVPLRKPAAASSKGADKFKDRLKRG